MVFSLSAAWKLVFALRTASLILRRRADDRLPFLRVAADEGGFAIDLPQSWLDENPLSADALAWSESSVPRERELETTCSSFY